MPQEMEKVLVLGIDNSFDEDTMNFAIQLSGRTGCEIHAVAITSNGALTRQESFFMRWLQKKKIRGFSKKAWEAGIDFNFELIDGEPGESAYKLCHSLKRVSFIITDRETAYEEIKGKVSLPVYIVKSINNNKRGSTGGFMGSNQATKGKYAAKTAVYGIITACLYFAVFSHAEFIMKLFNKGGIYAAFPIITVFVFSFAHGAFAGNLWSMLGIDGITQKNATEAA